MQFDNTDNFPGWSRASKYLENFAIQHNLRKLGDLGGGANPLMSLDFLSKCNIDYSILDISEIELAKSSDSYKKIQVDITDTSERFLHAVGKSNSFDLIFSHMFLEHVKDPIATHSNIRSILRPGGFAVHFYPSPYNLPLTVNRLFPEVITRKLLKISQPWRDVSGMAGKFPAYYRLCGNPGIGITKKFEELGYRIVEHTAYIGHEYYDSILMLRKIERQVRQLLLRWEIPLTSKMVLVLQRYDG